MIRIVVLLIAGLTIAGCASRFQPHGLTGGYLEQQQDGNIWKVSFRRNEYTDKALAIDYSLLRCAQLTLAKGFSHFGITAVKIGNEHGTITRSKDDKLTVVSNINFSGKPGLTNTIMLLRHPHDGNSSIFDAYTLCQSLIEKHDLDQALCQVEKDG